MQLKALQNRLRKLEAVVELDAERRIEEFFRAWDGTGDFPPGRTVTVQGPRLACDEFAGQRPKHLAG